MPQFIFVIDNPPVQVSTPFVLQSLNEKTSKAIDG